MSSKTPSSLSGEARKSLRASILERNRANAQHSTGPRTPEGKVKSSGNALKYGYSLTTHRILANEDPADFDQMLVDLREIYNPQSERENLAVREMAECRWAIRRLDLAEVSILNECIGDQPGDSSASEEESASPAGEAFGRFVLEHVCSNARSNEWKSLELLQRYRRPWQRRLEQAIRNFDRAVADRRRAEHLEIRKQQEQLKLELLQLRLAERREKARLQEERKQRRMDVMNSLGKSGKPTAKHARQQALEIERLLSGFVSQSGQPQPQLVRRAAASGAESTLG